MPTSEFPREPNLEHLRNQAKVLRRRVLVGDSAARELVREFHPRLAGADVQALAAVTLADAQLVIARQYGFGSWPKLRRHVEVVTRYARSPHRAPTGGPVTTEGARAGEFLRLACLTYGGDNAARRERARELLAAHPDIATASIHTMAAVGDVTAAAALLADDPAQASAPGGPHDWEPLLYLAYSRLDSTAAGHSTLEVARLLLASGADPNAGYLWEGTYPFTALTGVLGEGEDAVNQPRHQFWLPLARMLLDAGGRIPTTARVCTTACSPPATTTCGCCSPTDWAAAPAAPGTPGSAPRCRPRPRCCRTSCCRRPSTTSSPG